MGFTPKHLAFSLGLTIAGLTTNSKELEASIQEFVPSKSGWWLSYPSEKYEFVTWDDYSKYMENKKCSKPPSRNSFLKNIAMRQICSLLNSRTCTGCKHTGHLVRRKIGHFGRQILEYAHLNQNYAALCVSPMIKWCIVPHGDWMFWCFLAMFKPVECNTCSPTNISSTQQKKYKNTQISSH